MPAKFTMKPRHWNLKHTNTLWKNLLKHYTLGEWNKSPSQKLKAMGGVAQDIINPFGNLTQTNVWNKRKFGIGLGLISYERIAHPSRNHKTMGGVAQAL